MSDHPFSGTLSVTGNVGIGTEPSPKAQLYIKSTIASSQVFLEDSGGNLLKLSIDNNGATLGTDHSFPLSILTNGSPRLSINSAGNVGIGTTQPQAKLSVNGDFKLQAGVAVNEFSTDGALTANSDLAIPTQKAIKTYIDTKNNQVLTQMNTALLTKADLNGSASQDFQANNLTVNGSLLKVLGNLEVTGTTTFRNIEQHQGDLELGNEDTDQVRIHGTVRSTHSSGVLQFGSPINVNGNITANGAIQAGNSDIYFTKTDHDHIGIGNTKGFAAIENAKNYDALMILGRAGTSKNRMVKLWDYLQVNGSMDITGKLFAAGGLAYFWPPDNKWKHIENRFGDFAGSYDDPGPSDIRFKTDLRPIHNALEKVMQLQGTCYRWSETGLKYLTRNIPYLLSAGPESTEEENQKLWETERNNAYEAMSKEMIGLIAQQVETVLPEVIHEDEEGYKYIRYQQLIALLVEAIKEQNVRLQALSDRVTALEAM